ncbi:hypothetical protein EUTSA_v10011928mg [Eutrema salsugineum]|uniref:Uncharacterized protein n=1 Tax=Eutrema salsugineum TaxID=72664 RepID=V4KTV7_EUTSA|nr:hypothetical protein EUTSA_v10011928mg [Eutrema salsugineum]
MVGFDEIRVGFVREADLWITDPLVRSRYFLALFLSDVTTGHGCVESKQDLRRVSRGEQWMRNCKLQ